MKTLFLIDGLKPNLLYKLDMDNSIRSLNWAAIATETTRSIGVEFHARIQKFLSEGVHF